MKKVLKFLKLENKNQNFPIPKNFKILKTMKIFQNFQSQRTFKNIYSLSTDIGPQRTDDKLLTAVILMFVRFKRYFLHYAIWVSLERC